MAKVKAPKTKVHPNTKAPKNEPGGGSRRKASAPYSPLASMTPKELRQQATQTMRAVYKPSFKQLGREQARMMAISAKRKNDNAYYLNWLDKKSAQLQAHQDASAAALIQAGQDAQLDTEQSFMDMRDKLVSTGEATPGVVSSPGDATAFDVSGAANQAQELISNERQRTADLVGALDDASAVAAASNFAFIGAQEAKRTADQWEALSKLGDAKQQLRLSKGADTAKEIARLLDREVQKAQIRGSIQSSQAQAALEARRFGLDIDKFRLDAEKFDFEQTESNRNYGLEKGKLNETKRWHDIEKELKGSENKADRQQAQHKVTAIIQEGISTIASNKNLQKRLEKNPEAVKRRLMKVLGSATAANAAVELVSTGRLNPTTRQDLRALGYVVPPKWR